MDRHPVLLAMDSALFADALRSTLDGSDLEVISTTYDVETAVAEAVRVDPALAVVSADLPGAGGGLGLCARLMNDDSLRTMTLVIASPGSQEQMMAALEVGALGYATASTSLHDLIEDMHGVLRGEARVPRLMLGGLLRGLIASERRKDSLLDRYASLSKRERQILGLLAQGYDHVQIAARLVISPQTARTHIQNLLSKLGVHSRLEATALALEHGWVHMDAQAGT